VSAPASPTPPANTSGAPELSNGQLIRRLL